MLATPLPPTVAAPSFASSSPSDAKSLEPRDALFAAGDRIVLQCGSRLVLRGGDTIGREPWYQTLPGSAPTDDFDLLSVSDEGLDAIATPAARDVVYFWHDGAFTIAAVGTDARVLCGDAKSRVVVYAAANKIFVFDLQHQVRDELPVPSATVGAARSLPRGCVMDGEHVLLPSIAPVAAEHWNTRTRRLETRVHLLRTGARAQAFRLVGSRYGFVECQEEQGSERCRPRAFAMPSATSTELASVNDLNRVREASEFQWARATGGTYFLRSDRGSLEHRRSAHQPLASVSAQAMPNDSVAPLDLSQRYLRVRGDGTKALMQVSVGPVDAGRSGEMLYDLSEESRSVWFAGISLQCLQPMSTRVP